MFEKEAEEYGLENYRNYDDYPYVLSDEKAITKAFRNGADFGYNKGKEEIEKENVELRNNGFTVSAMTEQQLKVALEKGELLEKENEDLKKDNKNLREKVHFWKKETNVAHRSRADELDHYIILSKNLEKQLTKAKEIIRQFVNDYPVITKDLLDKLEQFKNILEEK